MRTIVEPTKVGNSIMKHGFRSSVKKDYICKEGTQCNIK